MSDGQTSDYRGALILPVLPKTKVLPIGCVMPWLIGASRPVSRPLAPHPHRYDRCAHTFMSAIARAATVIP